MYCTTQWEIAYRSKWTQSDACGCAEEDVNVLISYSYRAFTHHTALSTQMRFPDQEKIATIEVDNRIISY